MLDNRLISELVFTTSKSGGPGGQHVNKTETKVELLFDIQQSQFLSDRDKRLLFENLKNRINLQGLLRIVVSETRSQAKNKEIAISRFFEVVKKGLIRKKKRIATKTPRKAIKKRLKEKAKKSDIKKSRGNVSDQDY